SKGMTTARASREDEPRIDVLWAEHRRDALGIGTPAPRLSWTVAAGAADWRQEAYELELLPGDAPKATGRIASHDSVLVDWPFAPLASRERVEVGVRVWSDDGRRSAWSEPLAIEVGLLRAEDWTARFVSPGWDEDLSTPQPCPYLRCDFELPAEVSVARLYVTALGVYEPYLNGEVVGDHVLAPGWTSYDHRLRVQTFAGTE